MKKLVLLSVLASFLFVSAARAAEANEPAKEPKYRGRVVVVKDANDAITAVQLVSPKLGTFNIVLDAKGKELGEKLVGKRVAVKAVEAVIDGAKWLTVESYREIQQPQAGGGKKVDSKKDDGGKKEGDGKKGDGGKAKK